MTKPEENLALDERLLNDAEEAALHGREVLRFWESEVYFAVVGSSGKLRQEVKLEACQRNGIPVLRRCSGGGSVLIGPGCLNFTLILSLDDRPELRDLHQSYREILKRTSRHIRGSRIKQQGMSDLALDERKISGNAQRRKSHTILHHGTILYDFDLTAMTRFLELPPKQPAYRDNRSHETFAGNLRLSPEEIKLRIARSWNAVGPDGDWSLPQLSELIRAKYANPAWTLRF